jgi:uncharacterized flavoprotein (TIGR03862 family)
MASVSIIGGGPTGLMAAEVVAKAGHSVTIYDQMPSPGRKFLMAGRGGLNLTHSEGLDEDLGLFMSRYGAAASWLKPAIRHFPPKALIEWCHGLGQETFTGSSGRIFPKCLKSSPLLRAWLQRLDRSGVRFVLKRRWMGWNSKGELIFLCPDGNIEHLRSDATLLALGGASWPRLGADGGWAEILEKHSVVLSKLRPSNCGFIVPWSEVFSKRFAGQPLKPAVLTFGDQTLQCEIMITAKGIEGGGIYALSAALRDAILAEGAATLSVDLRPGVALKELITRLETPRGSQSMTNHLRKYGGLSSLAIGLVYETTPLHLLQKMRPEKIAALIKTCPLRLTATTSIDRAISTAGGICRDALNEYFMLHQLPGVFAAGEMLDWEAPTGGYLLQADFSTAVAAANGLIKWINSHAKI